MASLSKKERLLKKQSVEEDLKEDLGSNKDQTLGYEIPPQEPESDVDEGSDTEDDVIAVMMQLVLFVSISFFNNIFLTWKLVCLLSSIVFVYFLKISKLGIPIKTTVSATVLEVALNGKVFIHPLPLGQPLLRKVEKQGAHFYSISMTEEDLSGGIVCRVHS